MSKPFAHQGQSAGQRKEGIEGIGEPELYEIQVDQGQKFNPAQDKKHEQCRRQLSAELQLQIAAAFWRLTVPPRFSTSAYLGPAARRATSCMSRDRVGVRIDAIRIDFGLQCHPQSL